jgi:Cu+-exporting ATPase
MQVETTGRRYEHDGRTYFFCSDHCLAKFKESPDTYLSESLGETTAALPGTEYTCPMHPEVLTSEPGDCPICGMALEPKTAGHEDEDEAPELRDMSRRLWFAVILTVPLLIVAMGDMLPGAPVSRLISTRGRVLLELTLASPVCLWAAWPFYVRAVASVLHADWARRERRLCLQPSRSACP